MAQRLAAFRKTLLQAQAVGLDTMIFLYHFADHKDYSPLTEIVFQEIEHGTISAVTTTITISEIFVRVEEAKDRSTGASYEQFIRQLSGLEVIEIDWYSARLGAKLRAEYKALRLPDALQLAAPLLKNYPLYITNDKRLKSVREIDMVLLDEFV